MKTALFCGDARRAPIIPNMNSKQGENVVPDQNAALGPWEPERANNFDFLRFALAALVLFSHSWLLLGKGWCETREPWISLLACFWTGAAFYAWRAHIPRRASIAVLCLALLVPLTMAGRLGEWLPFALAYPLFYAAFTPGPLNRWKKTVGGDYSYGAYLYGSPVQFTLAAALGAYAYLNPLTFFALALPLASVCAVLSWRLVEAPCLASKTKRANAPVLAAVTTPAV